MASALVKPVPTPFCRRDTTQCVSPREYLGALIIATRDTGLGKKDLLALTWRNVDLVDRLLILPVGRQHFRLIGVTARLFDELWRRWLRSERNPDLKVFGGIKNFNHAYRTACLRVGVPYLRFCDLAKGFAVDLAAAGIPLKMAKQRAGLIDPRQERLTHISISATREGSPKPSTRYMSHGLGGP
jgi:integrase